MKSKYLIPITLLLVLLAFIVGRKTGGGNASSPTDDMSGVSERKPEFWTCAMHPSVRQPGPGLCPICAMELTPVFAGSQQELGLYQVELSENAIALANIQTTPVVRHLPAVEVRMVGKVDYDETRLSYITARVPGRLDRLYVDYTGVPVNKGEHLVSIYSPQLLAAQEELLQAIQTAKELQLSSDRYLRDRAEQTILSARDKLLLWGLSPSQVEEIEASRSASDHLTLYAPVGGIVIHKNAVEGMYVNEGTQIYTIADLSHVWVRLDAYESDFQWLHFGQAVEFSSEAYPGEKFTGWISFIDRALDPETRTLKVRVNVDNADGRLKPEMFVSAVVKSQITSDGRVMSPDLAGKWIGPMHPEIVRDEPGPCPICGMPLVQAESLGYSAAVPEQATLPLVIPATAPLITGKRAVVYVALPDQPGVFEGRAVQLGHRAGDLYIVESGLAEGELVVSHGAFKIDSAVQILAKPSMMNPKGGGPAAGHHHGGEETPEETADDQTVTYDSPLAFREQLRTVIDTYFPISDGLSHDNLEDAKTALDGLRAAIVDVDMSLLDGDAHMAWMRQLGDIKAGLNGMESSTEIEPARAEFERVSDGLILAANTFGLAGETPVYVYHCPMAMGGRGADWLQNKQGTENPYYGSMMFTCGSETRQIQARAAKTDAPLPE